MAFPQKRIGIVGAGLMGSRIGARIAAGDMPWFELAGVTDVDAARAAEVAESLHTDAFDTQESLMASGVDCLYIATPDDLHREPAVTAAKAGVPFLLEKPLATTVTDAEAIVSVVRASGTLAEVNFSNRWNPPYVAAKAEIDAGRLGAFRTLSVRLNNTLASPTANLAWAARTTPAWFLMSHCLDLAYWLHGLRVESVYASGTRGVLEAKGVDTWDSIRTVVRYDNGTDGHFEALWILPEGEPGPVDFNFRYVGNEGATTIDTSKQYITVADDTRLANLMTLNWTPARFKAFADAIDSGVPGVPVEDGLENTHVLVAIHRSLETGTVERVSRT